MIAARRRLLLESNHIRNICAGLAFATVLAAGSAFAGEEEASAALSRAEVKIETVTRVAGQAGDTGDQSFNMARERFESAKAAKKDNKYDQAEMMADEASLLADLTAERATLAALKVSHENLLRSVSAAAPVQ